jgi:hypothetical protein
MATVRIARQPAIAVPTTSLNRNGTRRDGGASSVGATSAVTRGSVGLGSSSFGAGASVDRDRPHRGRVRPGVELRVVRTDVA